MIAPQQITSRYARNLLIKGKNDDFYLLNLKRQQHILDGVFIANYYTIELAGPTGVKTGVGVTPEQALNAVLIKYGVTFR